MSWRQSAACNVPPNGPILERTIKALDRMGSGYVLRLDERGFAVFIHETMPPIVLQTGPDLTFGQILAQIIHCGVRVDEFLKHYPL